MPRFIYKGRKLGSFFPIKDKVDTKHKSGIVYGYQAPGADDNTYQYIGETSVRFESRIDEHSRTDKNSSIYKHSQQNNYVASSNNFCVLANGYNNRVDRKLCEALYIKNHKPILNTQQESQRLQLFN